MPDEQIKYFEDYCEIKIKPFLAELKKQNSSADKWGVFMIVFLLLSVLSFIVGISLEGYPDFVTVLLFILAIVSISSYTKYDDKYNDEYKEKIIKQIAIYLLPGIQYVPGQTISSKEYKWSGLYRRIYDYYDGEDFFHGIYKEVSFYCCELNVYKNDVKNESSYPHLGIFKGLFFVAPINIPVSGGTYIWAKEDEQLPVSIADEEYRLMHLPEVYKVNTQNTSFNKLFSVYSTYPEEADRILTDEMMEQMVNFKKQLQRNITFSFVAGKFYAAIPINENLLEPSAAPDDMQEVKKHFFTILLICSIINQLQLNKLV